MSTLRELKGRIGSVASSEKITGAMKMISSAKMHKAEQALGVLICELKPADYPRVFCIDRFGVFPVVTGLSRG